MLIFNLRAFYVFETLTLSVFVSGYLSIYISVCPHRTRCSSESLHFYCSASCELSDAVPIISQPGSSLPTEDNVTLSHRHAAVKTERY